MKPTCCSIPHQADGERLSPETGSSWCSTLRLRTGLREVRFDRRRFDSVESRLTSIESRLTSIESEIRAQTWKLVAAMTGLLGAWWRPSSSDAGVRGDCFIRPRLSSQRCVTLVGTLGAGARLAAPSPDVNR